MPCANLEPVFDTFPPRNIPQTGQTVVFFIPWILKAGGADRFLKELARGLSDYGITIVFILTEINIPQGSEDDMQDFMWNHDYVYRLPSFLHPENYDDFVGSLLNGMTDPILICMGSAYFYGFLQRNFTDLKSDGKIIDILFNDVGHVDAHSSVSHYFSDVVLAYSGLEASLTAKQILRGRSVVIPVGINHFNSGPRERKQVGNRPKLGWIGRFSREKRPEWFVNLARTHGDKADFHMVGTGPLLSDIESLSGKTKSLVIENHVENLGEFYNQLDLLIMTSEIEGIPLVLMEAMDHGIPVLSTKVGGIPDLIQHGINGYLTDAYRYSEMETALGMLLNAEDLLQKLQLNSSELRLGQDFYVDTMIRKYVDLLGPNK